MSAQRILEIGGTHVTAAVVNTAAWFVQQEVRLSLDANGTAEALVARIAECARALMDVGPTRWSVAIPGPFDYTRGVGDFRGVGKFEALQDVDLGSELARLLPNTAEEFVFVNDADAFALGEWFAMTEAPRRAVFLTLGTGIGSSFVDDGRPVTDMRGIPPHGWVCLMEWNGRPIEESVSRKALIESYRARSGRELDVHEIAAVARHGDSAAVEVFEEAFHALGSCLAPVVAAFDAETIVIGGSIARSWELISGPIRNGLQDSVPALAHVDLRRARNPDMSPLIGAARAATLFAPVSGL